MKLDLQVLAEWMRRAETDELLDRATIYRSEMEPAALDLIDAELARRGIAAETVRSYGIERRGQILLRSDGTAERCSRCNRPAVIRARRWWKLFRIVPIFPYSAPACDRHE